jgi:type II secretory pathway pseudopilin PulG
MLERILESFENVLQNSGELFGIFSGNISRELLIDFSMVIIIIAITIFLISIILLLAFSRKSSEEKVALQIISNMKNLKDGKKQFETTNDSGVEKTKTSEFETTKKPSVIKETEVNLKQLLIKKFKPIIEKQLKSNITINDFKASNEKFFVKITVQGNNLELVLDSSGKIIDYKRI